ncbi:conserved hypothetical protein [Burkholderiales bacterium 8X]|nr:conserved hypothetical protein [Burkholderiales bacterium 8X]
MAFKDLPAGMRPRERLVAHGAATLDDAELLALLLRTGLAGKNVMQLAQELLDVFGGLAGLLNTSLDDLKRIKGLGGNAKRAQLAAVLELARRVLSCRLKEREVLDRPNLVKDYLQLRIAHLPHEVFVVLFLDTHHRLIAFEEMFRGTLTHTSVYPREVVAQALQYHAAAVVLAHNHPSGLPEPSRADEAITQIMKAALALVDVRVLDHLVVASGGSVSMAERGIL